MSAGQSPVGTWALTNFTSDLGSTYKGKIDANFAVAQRAADSFAPHPASPAAMTVIVDAGFIETVTPGGRQTVTEVAQQTLTISAAPASPNNRIDLIVIDAGTGAASVVAGTPASSPVAPAVPAGKRQVAQVSVPNGTSAIPAANITDLRAVAGAFSQGVPFALASGSADAITAAFTPATPTLGAPMDGYLWRVRAISANATVTPSFAPDGQGPYTIKKANAATMIPGDIPGAGYEMLLSFNWNGGIPYVELLNAVVSSVPSGALMPFAGTSAPAGWLLCYGQVVAQADYPSLYLAIGSTFNTGGEGSGNFRLPDLRGRVAAGVDNMGGSAASRITSGNSGIAGSTLGAAGGDERMHGHEHANTLNDPGHTHFVDSASGASGPIGIISGGNGDKGRSLDPHTTGVTITNASAGSGASQNVQPTIMLNYIIKT